MKLRERAVEISVGVLAIVALAVLARYVGGTISRSGQASSRPAEVFVVRVAHETYASLGDFEALSVFDDEKVFWLELTAAQYQKLQDIGVTYQLKPDFFTLNFFDYHFDPLHKEPDLPPELTSAYAVGIPGLYIVQWRADVKDEWIDTLKSMGATFVDNWDLVRMTPNLAGKVGRLDFVRWVGVFHAAYRVRPRLLTSTNDVEKVVLVVYNDGQANGSVDRVIRAVKRLGGELLGDERPYIRPKDPAGVLFNLPTRAIAAAAQLNDVIFIDSGPSNKIE